MTVPEPSAEVRRCDVAGCDNRHMALGYCGSHYMRFRKHGDPLAGGITPRRFQTRQDAFDFYTPDRPTDGCWEWQGPVVRYYGRISWANQPVAAHRWSYERFVGPIPDGLTIDHLCGNTRCVNPAHLEPCTIGENVRRYHRKQTHCVNGHEFTPENTYLAPSRPNRRCCRACQRARQQGDKRRSA